MSIYTGKQKDRRKLIETDFILRSVNELDREKARKAHLAMVIERRDIGINAKLRKYLEKFKSEQFEYKSERNVLLRDKKPLEVIKIIAGKLGIEDISLFLSQNLMFYRDM